MMCRCCRDKSNAALIVWLCLGACLMLLGAGLVFRGEREPIIPPEAECWDAVSGRPCP